MNLVLHHITIIILTTLTSTTTSQPHRLHHHKPPQQPPHTHSNPQPTQSIELTPPLTTTNLPIPPQECTITLLRHSFANTYNQPPYSVAYSSASTRCPPPWSSAVLELSGSVSGDQYDRIAAVWLAGAEILRTSTPEPSVNGTFWNVYKDVTRYTSLLQQSNIELSMMLENVVNDEFTGVYHINLTLFLYKDRKPSKPDNFARKLGLGKLGSLSVSDYEQPADLIIPVMDEGNSGHWFRIEHELDVVSRRVKIPRNARRIVLELYVSYHGDDEFWYTNPPNEYIQLNNLGTRRGNGAYREVIVRVDGKFVGSEVPFPVIFTGGVNPLVWEPVVAIGAFDLPSYDFELTPFLGLLVDGKSHSFEITVANAIGLWLVDANLHIWVDKGFSKVNASLGFYKPPEFYDLREYQYNLLDGSFEVEALRASSYSGWVVSSSGNFTTSVTKKMHITSMITFLNNGTYKTVEHKTKVKASVRVVSDAGLVVSLRTSKRKAPLTIITSTVPGTAKDTSMMITNITHTLKENASNGVLRSSVVNNQVSDGWMLVKDHSVLSGTGSTRQTLTYHGQNGCFSRSVEATEGRLLTDISSSVCPSLTQTA